MAEVIPLAEPPVGFGIMSLGDTHKVQAIELIKALNAVIRNYCNACSYVCLREFPKYEPLVFRAVMHHMKGAGWSGMVVRSNIDRASHVDVEMYAEPVLEAREAELRIV